MNSQQTVPCYVDRELLVYGDSRILLIQSTVQLGRYGIIIEGEDNESSLVQLLGHGEGSSHDAQLPELMDILHNSLLHVTEEPELQKQDVLKALEKEFRQALIWGTQPASVRPVDPKRHHRFTANVFDFEHLQAQVKSATVTHCIFETPALIHRVFSELQIKESDALCAEEVEKKDILKLLAPEEVRYDTPKSIPALLVQEMYRADLDTLL